MKNNTKNWYSVIVSILLIGFLLILTIGVFTLVMKEYNDNKWLWDSIKAFAWAEASQELALLKIKENGYGIWSEIKHEISNDSIILSNQPNNTGSFIAQKEAFISYDLNVLADFNGIEYIYQDTLLSKEYSIIPLFYEDEERGFSYVENYNLDISWVPENLVWNIIAWNNWIGNNGWISLYEWNGKNITYNENDNPEIDFFSSSIEDFLPQNDAYLILFNSWDFEITFTLKSNDLFSKPKTKILSSAQVWKYRHNLETEYDNTEFLNKLKYAVFSN